MYHQPSSQPLGKIKTLNKTELSHKLFTSWKRATSKWKARINRPTLGINWWSNRTGTSSTICKQIRGGQDLQMHQSTKKPLAFKISRRCLTRLSLDPGLNQHMSRMTALFNLRPGLLSSHPLTHHIFQNWSLKLTRRVPLQRRVSPNNSLSMNMLHKRLQSALNWSSRRSMNRLKSTRSKADWARVRTGALLLPIARVRGISQVIQLKRTSIRIMWGRRDLIRTLAELHKHRLTKSWHNRQNLSRMTS